MFNSNLFVLNYNKIYKVKGIRLVISFESIETNKNKDKIALQILHAHETDAC